MRFTDLLKKFKKAVFWHRAESAGGKREQNVIFVQATL